MSAEVLLQSLLSEPESCRGTRTQGSSLALWSTTTLGTLQRKLGLKGGTHQPCAGGELNMLCEHLRCTLRAKLHHVGTAF